MYNNFADSGDLRVVVRVGCCCLLARTRHPHPTARRAASPKGNTFFLLRNVCTRICMSDIFLIGFHNLCRCPLNYQIVPHWPRMTPAFFGLFPAFTFACLAFMIAPWDCRLVVVSRVNIKKRPVLYISSYKSIIVLYYKCESSSSYEYFPPTYEYTDQV